MSTSRELEQTANTLMENFYNNSGETVVSVPQEISGKRIRTANLKRRFGALNSNTEIFSA